MPSFTASNSMDVVGSQVITGGLAVGQTTEVASGLTVATGDISLSGGSLKLTDLASTPSAPGAGLSLFYSRAGSLYYRIGASGAETTFGGAGITTNSLTIGTGLSGNSFNGSSAVTIALANTAVTPSSYTNANITVDAQGRITAASNGSGSGGTTTNSLTIGTGLSGGSFNGSSAVTIALANTAVTAGYYTNANITIDAQGRITGAANGSSGGGGGGSSTYTKTCNFVGPISVQNGTARWYPDQSVTVTSVYINASTAPTSGPFSIAVEKNGATIATASLSAGSYTSSVTAVNVAFTSSDYVTIDVTASNGAADAAVILLYTRA